MSGPRQRAGQCSATHRSHLEGASPLFASFYEAQDSCAGRAASMPAAAGSHSSLTCGLVARAGLNSSSSCRMAR